MAQALRSHPSCGRLRRPFASDDPQASRLSTFGSRSSASLYSWHQLSAPAASLKHSSGTATFRAPPHPSPSLLATLSPLKPCLRTRPRTPRNPIQRPRQPTSRATPSLDVGSPRRASSKSSPRQLSACGHVCVCRSSESRSTSTAACPHQNDQLSTLKLKRWTRSRPRPSLAQRPPSPQFDRLARPTAHW